MKYKELLLLLLASVPPLLASCSTGPTSPNGSGNLISNPDLRSGSSPSLAGWEINDTARVKVVANAPPGSETWSMWLAPSFDALEGGVAKAYITGQSGSAVYRFSCWERNFAGWYFGYVSLTQMRNGESISYRNMEMSDTNWTTYTLTDTLNMLPTDTLAITLAASSLALFQLGSPVPVDTVSSGVCFNQLSLVKGM